MRLKQGILLLAILAAVVGLAVSCGDNGTRATFDGAGVRITLEKSSLAESVSIVELEVRMLENDSLVFSGTAGVIDGQFQFEPFELPAGQAVFTARGLDTEGLLLYEGSTLATIIGGVNNTVDLTLTPAVPMVRIGPYFDDAQVGQTHTCFLELYNLSAFAAGTFTVEFNSGFLVFKSATQASLSWGQLSIDVSGADAGIQIAVGRPQGAGDAIPTNVVQLLRLDFDAVNTDEEETEIEVSVSRVINAQGQTIPEFSTLRAEPQTLLITMVTGNLSGVVTDAISGDPIADAGIEISGSVTAREGSTSALGQYQFADLPAGDYEIFVFAGGYAPLDDNITIAEGSNTRNFQLTPLAGNSSLSGTVVDAQSGGAIVGANVTISGPAQRQALTSIDGRFQFQDIPLGDYDLAITADGYIDFQQFVTVGTEPVDLSFAISQQLGNALYRITLSWGSLPFDLDAYLWAKGNVISWQNPGSEDSEPFIFLDLDDRDGNGPETITIFDLSTAATFAVHNWSGEFDDGIDINQSGAHVNVYRDDALVNSYDVPRVGDGLWWHVFDIDANGNIITRNVILDGPPVPTTTGAPQIPARKDMPKP